jgi:hypothetical protein
LELSHFHEPILESKKVQDFLKSNLGPRASGFCPAATAALMADFEQAANVISLSVQLLNSQSRDIGGTSSDLGRGRRGGRGRPGRGGGPSQGRGGHNARQG